jgi:LuxR family transcriptional regulator, maltose regulon positive regulatory protein
MSIRNLIILSQVNPPAQRSHVLIRERVSSLLRTSLTYPLTMIQAGTGYGKSTAIISFVHTQPAPVYWFTISGTDRDPTLFLAKLFTAFNQHKEGIGEEALRVLDMPDATQMEALIALVNAAAVQIMQPALLILDDFHRVRDITEITQMVNWLVENLPPSLHLVLASRQPIELPSLNSWRVKDSVYEFGKEELAFTHDEIHQLFSVEYHMELSPQEVAHLSEKTEGWAIGLQMIWQTLRSNPGMTILDVLENQRESQAALFEYLAEEVLNRLDSPTQRFLLRTSILSRLDSSTCDFLLTSDKSDEILRKLNNTGMFIEELRPGVYRYHQIFREFLLNRLQQNSGETLELHRKIASYFTAHEYWEQALFHLISAGDYRQISQVLENIGESMIRDGRQETVRYWINAIPETLRKNLPYINYLLGEIYRLSTDFDPALEYYHASERLHRSANNHYGVSLALRGQAQVYLDTIRPVNADQLLQDAIKLLNPKENPQQYADLLVLAAENQLNLGNPDGAESLLSQARQLRRDLDDETDLIQARILLRTGRIHEGIDLLSDRESDQQLPAHLTRPQRFHREASLLLSLFYAIIGDIEKCEFYARRGISIGEKLQSTFVQSVGYMRLGHALQLRYHHPWNTKGFDQALDYYQQAIDKIDVVRIHVEPLWGKCRALGYSERIDEARQMAHEALEIAQKAGDRWMCLLIHLSLGAGQVLTGQYEQANQSLTTAESMAVSLKDTYLLCVVRMWLAINAWHQHFENTAFSYLEKLLPMVHAHRYEYLLLKETYLGLKDRSLILPLLLAARENGIEAPYLSLLLRDFPPDEPAYHPGYSLWVQTFGAFSVWRGSQAIDNQDWKREKARQFFQILIANREKWLTRDQILNMLWPDTMADTAANNLKVVLNQLNQVLEPDRPRGSTPFFIERSHDLYRLNPNGMILVDAEMFEQEASASDRSRLEAAVQLYQGQYFQDSEVQEWLTVEVQYYHQRFLLAAENLINLLLDNAELEKALQVTYQMLSMDQFYEAAYCAQMQIFHQMGQDSMVHTTYQECQKRFRKNFNTDVSLRIQAAYEELTEQKSRE